MMKFLKEQALVGALHTVSQCEQSDCVKTITVSNYVSYCFSKLTEWVGYWFKQKTRDTRWSSTALHRCSSIINWALLVKVPKYANKMSDDEKRFYVRNDLLNGKLILCVGGRIRLYPIYQQLIKNSGGNLVTFHGDSGDHLDSLSQLLRVADMIICPIDCINHDDYFVVKNYCQHSGKPCVLLDRSVAGTFAVGVDMLSHMATCKLNKKECA